MAIFYRSLATLFAAGVRIDRSLSLLGEAKDDAMMATVSRSLCSTVTAGASVSWGMALWPDIFSPMHQKLVHVGEVSGRLEDILERLSIYEEKRRGIGMRVQSALTYPIILFILAMAALIFVPPYLFGGLFQLIETSGVEIPLITRVLLMVSKFVSTPWFYLLGAIVIAVALKTLPPILRRPEVRLLLTRYALKIPVIGKAIKIIAVTRFARSMEILVTVGVNIDQALEMSMEASNNPVMEEATPAVVHKLRNGGTLAEALSEADFFPRAFIQMVSVGEESGKLPTLISKLADIYEVELEYTLEIAIQALEPIMLLFMGIVVGLVIIATMMPMMQVIQHL